MEILASLKIRKAKEAFQSMIDAGKKKNISSFEAEAIYQAMLNKKTKTIFERRGWRFHNRGNRESMDLFGLPKSAADKFKMPEFIHSVDVHFRKSVDFVVFDARFMTQEQFEMVMKHIRTTHTDDISRLRIIR